MSDTWQWHQPKTQAELLSRLADARDLDVPERERENLCACAITEIKRLNVQHLTVACAMSEREDKAEAELERVKPHWEQQLAQLRADLARAQGERARMAEGVRVQAAAVRTLDRKERAEYLATETLDSERAMNAALTEEIERLAAESRELSQATGLLTTLATARPTGAELVRLLTRLVCSGILPSVTAFSSWGIDSELGMLAQPVAPPGDNQGAHPGSAQPA